MRVVALTTTDNPFDPIEEFEKWQDYDNYMGYATSGLLARFVQSTDIDSDSIMDEEIESSIDRILDLFGTETYQKVVKTVDD